MSWEKVSLDERRDIQHSGLCPVVDVIHFVETKDERLCHPEQNDRIHVFSCHSERSVSGVEESREGVL